MKIKWRKLLLRIGVVLLLAALIYAYRFFLWARLVQPVAFVFWALWRVIASVDQIIYWYLLICLSVFFLVRQIPNEPQENSAYSHHAGGMVKGAQRWHNLLQTALDSPEKRLQLRRELELMLITGLVLQDRSDRETVKQRLAEKAYPFPSEVYDYFYPDENRWIARLQESLRQSGWVLPGWLHLDKKKYQQTILGILQWMENTLEAPYDESYNR